MLVLDCVLASFVATASFAQNSYFSIEKRLLLFALIFALFNQFFEDYKCNQSIANTILMLRTENRIKFGGI